MADANIAETLADSVRGMGILPSTVPLWSAGQGKTPSITVTTSLGTTRATDKHLRGRLTMLVQIVLYPGFPFLAPDSFHLRSPGRFFVRTLSRGPCEGLFGSP